MTTFFQFLAHQQTRRDAVGSLARLAATSADFSRTSRRSEIRAWLLARGARPEVLLALYAGMSEFRGSVARDA